MRMPLTERCIKEGYLRLYMLIIEKFIYKLFKVETMKYDIEPIFGRP